MVDIRPKLENHYDGSVWRTSYCGCGKVLYKKCLTSGEIVVLVKRNGGVLSNEFVFQPLQNPSVSELHCAECGAGHLLFDNREEIGIRDELIPVLS